MRCRQSSLQLTSAAPIALVPWHASCQWQNKTAADYERQASIVTGGSAHGSRGALSVADVRRRCLRCWTCRDCRHRPIRGRESGRNSQSPAWRAPKRMPMQRSCALNPPFWCSCCAAAHENSTRNARRSREASFPAHARRCRHRLWTCRDCRHHPIRARESGQNSQLPAWRVPTQMPMQRSCAPSPPL
jgi:hypothetical protein